MKFQSRKYQQKDIKSLTKKLLKDQPKIIYQLPTGGGKTFIAIQICKEFSKKCANVVGYRPTVYWVTHRRELERQSTSALAEVGIYNFRVSSPIKFFNKIKRNEVRPTKFNLLIVDECHHATAPTWQRLVSTWPGPVLGLTATPWRLSKREGFNHLFSELIIGPSIQDLINQQYLVPCLVKSIPNKIQGYGNVGGEYSGKQIMKYNSRDVLIEGAIHWLVNEMGEDSRILIYASGVEHCEGLQNHAFEVYGLESHILLGKTSTKERDQIIDEFKSGKTKILINFNVLTEGFDVPEADMAMILRPTQSLALYLQMIGRVIRKSNNKLYAVILDSTDNHIMHGLPEIDRQWSLEPRVNYDPNDKTGGFTRKCIFCEAILHAAKRECNFCHNKLGFKCVRCGKFSWWQSLASVKNNQCKLCTEQIQNIITVNDDNDQILSPCLLGGEMEGQIGAIYISKDYPGKLFPGVRIIMQYQHGREYDHIKVELARRYNEQNKTWKMIYSTWKNHQKWVLGKSEVEYA